MINKKSFINESKLNQLIHLEGSHIVNIEEDYFQYCNGYFLVNCTYDLDSVIQKLFKVGAISNYRNWKPTKTHDFQELVKCECEIEATLTPYLKMCGNKNLANIFKIGNNFVSYNKNYIDMFKNVKYKASNDSKIPNLRIYGDGKFIGLLMPIRDEHDLLVDIIGS